MASEVLVPSSPAEAVELFGDGAATTVVGGGTIVVADITLRAARSGPRAPALARRARRRLGRRRHGHDRRHDVRSTRCSRSRSTPPPSPRAPATSPTTRFAARARSAATSASAPGTMRRAATCRAACSRSTRSVRSAGADGERTEPLEDFLADRQRAPRARRQLRAARRLGLRRARVPAHARVHGARGHGRARGRTARRGSPRPASPGPARAFAPPRRWPSDPAAAGAAAVGDVTFADDALASAWYREQTLPVLVRRVLTQLEESS